MLCIEEIAGILSSRQLSLGGWLAFIFVVAVVAVIILAATAFAVRFILLNAVLCNLFALGKFAPFGVGLVGLDRSGLLVVIIGAWARGEDGKVKNETAPKLQVG